MENATLCFTRLNRAPRKLERFVNYKDILQSLIHNLPPAAAASVRARAVTARWCCSMTQISNLCPRVECCVWESGMGVKWVTEWKMWRMAECSSVGQDPGETVESDRDSWRQQQRMSTGGVDSVDAVLRERGVRTVHMWHNSFFSLLQRRLLWQQSFPCNLFDYSVSQQLLCYCWFFPRLRKQVTDCFNWGVFIWLYSLIFIVYVVEKKWTPTCELPRY